MTEFADHFSQSAASYAAHRPHYPAELFDWLASIAPARERAWDCGTGSGQAAIALVPHFRTVVATDPSVAQLVHASRSKPVRYAAMTAERSALAAGSVHLVTVAQALHWFTLPAFYEEVRRVLAPEGVLAVWSYGLLSVNAAIDERISAFYGETVGPYWPAERALVDAGYGRLSFPFREIEAPRFSMEANWTLPQFAGFLNSWSAVGRYVKANGVDPVPPFIETLRPLWRAHEQVRWPLAVRAGRV